jgi:hypothetical protein
MHPDDINGLLGVIELKVNPKKCHEQNTQKITGERDRAQRTYVFMYQEYHRVCPLDRIGTPSHPSPTSECVPSPELKGGGHTRLRLRGGSQLGRLEKKPSTVLCLLCGAELLICER